MSFVTPKAVQTPYGLVATEPLAAGEVVMAFGATELVTRRPVAAGEALTSDDVPRPADEPFASRRAFAY